MLVAVVFRERTREIRARRKGDRPLSSFGGCLSEVRGFAIVRSLGSKSGSSKGEDEESLSKYFFLVVDLRSFLGGPSEVEEGASFSG